MASEIQFSDFEKVDLRIGTIVSAAEFVGARKPAYQLQVDFGDSVGCKKTSAQITDLYTADELIGRQVVGVLNLPPKQIGSFTSEFLVLGAVPNDGKVVLLAAERPVPNGTKIS